MRKLILITGIMLIVLGLVGCGGGSPTPSQLDPSFTPPDEIQMALDAALSYVRANYTDQAPPADADWAGANITPEDLVGSVTYAFESGDFHIEINHCVCAPEDIEYLVGVSNHVTGFSWGGLVKPDGSVTETPTIE